MIERMAVDPFASPAQCIREHIRTVPDWPAPGVMFRGITPLLANLRVFRVLIDQFVHRYFNLRPDVIAGLDARGFIIGSATVEMHTGAVRAGARVVLIEDLIASVGTMMAGKTLLERLGALVIEGAAIVDLRQLQRSAKLRAAGLPLFTLMDFARH